MKPLAFAAAAVLSATIAGGRATAQYPYGDSYGNGPAPEIYYPFPNGYVYEPASVYLVPFYRPYAWPDYGVSYGYYTAQRPYRPYERGFVAPNAYDQLWYSGYVPGYIDPYDPYVVYARRGLFQPPAQVQATEPASGIIGVPADDRPAPLFDTLPAPEEPAENDATYPELRAPEIDSPEDDRQ